MSYRINYLPTENKPPFVMKILLVVPNFAISLPLSGLLWDSLIFRPDLLTWLPP